MIQSILTTEAELVLLHRAVDLVLTTMTLYRGLKHKAAGSSSTLIDVFIKDGVFYFVAISSLNLINVIFFVYVLFYHRL